MFREAIRLFIGTRANVIRQFMRYAVVGASVTALDFGTYLWLTYRVPAFEGRYVLAATVSFLCAVCVSFVCNNFWTFGRDRHGWHRRAPKFLTVAVIGLCLNALLLHTIVWAGAHHVLAKVIATFVVTGWNFTMQKFWTFRA